MYDCEVNKALFPLPPPPYHHQNITAYDDVAVLRNPVPRHPVNILHHTVHHCVMTAATHTTNGSDDDTDRDDKTSAGIILYRIIDDVVQFLMLKSPNGNWLPPKGE